MTGSIRTTAAQRFGPVAWTGRRQGRALRRVTGGAAERPLGLGDLEREALSHSRLIVAALMTPGQRFPTRRQLSRAWRAIRALDLAEAGQRGSGPMVG